MKKKLGFLPMAVTIDRAVAAAGTSRTAFYQALKAKEITARKDGKATLVEVEEIVRWTNGKADLNSLMVYA